MRLVSTWSSWTGSAATSGVSRIIVRTRTPTSRGCIRCRTDSRISSIAIGSFAGTSAPASNRARSSMLPIRRLSRSVSSRTVWSRSRRCASSWAASSSSRLVTAALIDASGVRRSCVTEENRAARAWLVSASSRRHVHLRVEPRAIERDRDLSRRRLEQPSSRPGGWPSARTTTSVPNTSRPRRVGARVLTGRRQGSRVWTISYGRPPSRLDLAGRQVKRTEQRAGEVLQDPFEGLARQDLGGQVAEEPRLALPRAARAPPRAPARRATGRSPRPRGTRRARPRPRSR